MTEFSTSSDVSAWQSGFEDRLRVSYRSAGLNDAAAEQRISRLREESGSWTVTEVRAGGDRVGFVAVGVADDNGTPTGCLGDLWIDTEHRGRGHENAARAWAERWCAERGAARLRVQLTRPDELFADYPVRGQTRFRAVAAPVKPVDGVSSRPMTQSEYPEWLTGEKAAYTADIVRAGALTPEEARLKSERDFEESLPQGLATPDNTFLVLEATGEPVGTGWLKHGFLPGVTFGYSLEINAEQRGRGYGRAAMAIGEQAAAAAGDSVLMFNVFGGNDVAMNLYTSAGYRILEENRSIDLAAHGR